MATIGIDGRAIPAKQYLAGLRFAKANPAAMFKRTLKSWEPGTGAEIMQEYRRDLHHMINQRGGLILRKSRLHPQSWGFCSMPRVILERHEIQGLNRHQRPHLINRQRES